MLVAGNRLGQAVVRVVAAWISPRSGGATWAMAPEYGLLVTPPAQRAMDRLPERVAAAITELLTGDLLAAPRRVGKPLRRELSGLWSARRGSYRVIYPSMLAISGGRGQASRARQERYRCLRA
jgi:mRNA-degrading endonuclease RelE of RelBE toxin-antitoxin system